MRLVTSTLQRVRPMGSSAAVSVDAAAAVSHHSSAFLSGSPSQLQLALLILVPDMGTVAHFIIWRSARPRDAHLYCP